MKLSSQDPVLESEHNRRRSATSLRLRYTSDLSQLPVPHRHKYRYCEKVVRIHCSGTAGADVVEVSRSRCLKTSR